MQQSEYKNIYVTYVTILHDWNEFILCNVKFRK